MAWWIMTFDSLGSWFTIGPIQCASHTLVHSPWETHPDDQDKPLFQLWGDALQSLLDCLNPWTNCGQLIYLQGTHDLYLLHNSWCTQVMYNVRVMDWMLKSMLIHQKDSKGMVKSNFVTSCLAFRNSIPTFTTHLRKVNNNPSNYYIPNKKQSQ